MRQENILTLFDRHKILSDARGRATGNINYELEYIVQINKLIYDEIKNNTQKI